jgi:hypothetical protein
LSALECDEPADARHEVAGTNARNRRGLSTATRRKTASLTFAARSLGRKTVSVTPYPGRAALRAVKL